MRLTFITRNWTLKLFSLVVSVVIFLFVSVESATPVDVDYGIHYVLPDNVVLVGNYPRQVHATLQGPWASLRDFDAESLRPLEIDLTSERPGSKVLRPIAATDLAVPGGMTVVSLRPAEVVVALDSVAERPIRVNVPITGSVAERFEIREVRVDPREVMVSGPLAELGQLASVSTDPVTVAGRRESFKTELDVVPPSPSLRPTLRRVQVWIEIGEEHRERTFENVVVTVDHAPPGTRVTPESVVITLRGPRLIIDSLDSSGLVAFVDARPEVDQGKFSFEKVAELRVPPDRTTMVGQAPTVVVQIPKRARRR